MYTIWPPVVTNPPSVKVYLTADETRIWEGYNNIEGNHFREDTKKKLYDYVQRENLANGQIFSFEGTFLYEALHNTLRY